MSTVLVTQLQQRAKGGMVWIVRFEQHLEYSVVGTYCGPGMVPTYRHSAVERSYERMMLPFESLGLILPLEFKTKEVAALGMSRR